MGCLCWQFSSIWFRPCPVKVHSTLSSFDLHIIRRTCFFILISSPSSNKAKRVTVTMVWSHLWFKNTPSFYSRLFRLKLMFQVCIAGSCLPSLDHLLQIYYWNWAIKAGCDLSVSECVPFMDNEYRLTVSCLDVYSWSCANASTDFIVILAIQDHF